MSLQVKAFEVFFNGLLKRFPSFSIVNLQQLLCLFVGHLSNVRTHVEIVDECLVWIQVSENIQNVVATEMIIIRKDALIFNCAINCSFDNQL
jgi:hypothetical protein